MVRLGLLAPMKQGLNLCQTPLFALLGRRLTIAHPAAVRVGRQTVAYPGKSQNTRNQGEAASTARKKCPHCSIAGISCSLLAQPSNGHAFRPQLQDQPTITAILPQY